MSEHNDIKPRHPWRRTLAIARTLFTPLSIIVIFVFAWRSRTELGEILQSGKWSFLLAALLLWIATNILAPLVTVYLFRSCRMKIGYVTTLFIHCSRLPAKYLPGGIWHSVGRAADYSTLGHQGKKIGLYFLVENVLLIAVTLGMSASFVEHMIRIPAFQTAVSLLPYCMGLALLMFPLLLRLYTKNAEPFSLVGYIVALGLLVVYWCMIGTAFVTYISAFEELNLTASALETAAIYIFSWVLGYLALFAPQGIGVAEYISGTLLTDGSQAGAILALLVGFRVLALVADITTWFVVTFTMRKFKLNQ